MVSATAITSKDELAHATSPTACWKTSGSIHDALIYGRAPHEFKHPYGFDYALDNWAELVVATASTTAPAITLLGDVYRNTSYGPLKRALVKVDQEETSTCATARCG